MSIPLKAACGAATLTFALTPGVGPVHADQADTARAGWGKAAGRHVARSAPSRKGGRPVGKQGAPAGPTTRHGGYGRLDRFDRFTDAAWQARQMLAARQRAVRRKRARLIARWQGQADRAVRFAMSQRGKPYRWGATGPDAYDCSGLVQKAWERAGVSIPRVTHAQYRGIPKKVPRHRLRPGDLLLFNEYRHVGMYIGRGRFVHAPRTGRAITDEPLAGYYARTYVGAVRPAWPQLPKIPKF